MLEAANEYGLKIEAMNKMHREEMERLEERKNQEKLVSIQLQYLLLAILVLDDHWPW